MSANKTKPTNVNAEDFLNTIEHPQKRADSFKILEMMKDITGEEPIMWGDSIVGFGVYHYKYKTGREGDWPIVGFSPRKQNLSIYLMIGYESELKPMLLKLGKYKTGVSCLYINKLNDVDTDILRELIEKSYKWMLEKYPDGYVQN
jgi:hypothetical protein